MKDNLFEMLLTLFETSLTQLQKSQKSTDQEAIDQTNAEESVTDDDQLLHIRTQQQQSTRVITYDEQMKLTKASYQFLMRLQLWGILNTDSFELVMNQLQFSDSRIVNLQETKWTIRNVLSSRLNEEQLAFLDLILYQAEDEFIVH
ncbi:MAG: DUF494 family protein [Legionella sp.]|uniref:DUF494 family protein n=1 Tax=Legionella sp. TaxID=459 RepID=UPI0039E470D9